MSAFPTESTLQRTAVMHVELVEIKMQVEGRQSKLLCKYDQISSVVNVQAELETTYEKGAVLSDCRSVKGQQLSQSRLSNILTVK